MVLVAAACLVAPWLVRNQTCFGATALTQVTGRSLWWSCFKGDPADRLDPPLPFADGPATQSIRRSLRTVSPHNTWGTFKALVRLGCSESAADDLMLRGAKEGIQARPWQYLLSRGPRFVWFWLTPNETYRPLTGDFEFSVERPDLTLGKAAAAGTETGPVEGQATWAADWYFRRGCLNVLWHPHPLVYALAALASVVAIGLLGLTPATRRVALFFGLWLTYFSLITTLLACPAYRYRMILEPTMIILVVGGWEALLARYASRPRVAAVQ